MTTEATGDATHWDAAYAQGDTTRSWFQSEAAQSLKLIDDLGVETDAGVIDVGGGASVLIDALLARHHTDVTVLDISATGIDAAKARLGASADSVTWLVTDLLEWQPDRTYDVWHDRAVFHFMTSDDARDRYLAALVRATAPGSLAILATFAPDGPQYCSGLPVCRYDAADLAAELGNHWHAIVSHRQEHKTPSGAMQPFTWAAFRRER